MTTWVQTNPETGSIFFEVEASKTIEQRLNSSVSSFELAMDIALNLRKAGYSVKISIRRQSYFVYESICGQNNRVYGSSDRWEDVRLLIWEDEKHVFPTVGSCSAEPIQALHSDYFNVQWVRLLHVG